MVMGLFGREVMGSSGIILHCSSSMGRSSRFNTIMVNNDRTRSDYSKLLGPMEPFEPTPGCGFTLTAIQSPIDLNSRTIML